MPSEKKCLLSLCTIYKRRRQALSSGDTVHGRKNERKITMDIIIWRRDGGRENISFLDRLFLERLSFRNQTVFV